MVQKQYIIKRQKGKHLTLSERGKIEAYWNMGLSKTEIALRIGVSRRTIQREIQRGWVSGLLTSELDTYVFIFTQTAQRKYEEKQNSKEGNLKIGKINPELLEQHLLWLSQKGYHTMTLSEYIGEGAPKKTVLLTLDDGYYDNYKYVFPLLKKYNMKATIFLNTLYISEDRKQEEEIQENGIANQKAILQYVETGCGESAQYMTWREIREMYESGLVDFQAHSHKHMAVFADNKLQGFFQGTEEDCTIKTITSDNGSEFMNASAIERLGIPYFYAHSYCSWERGSNENNNKLIRRYLPKGMDIGEVSEERIKEIEEWMNTYPRKLWNGKSSKEMHAEEFTTYLC
ncbi:IS30 family transposase [Fusobacterium necrophorum subsp. funduliforme]